MNSSRRTERLPRRIQRPIIILGSGRSGTSLVARLFSRHPDVAYLPEPRPIWMFGHSYRRHHRLGREDLTPRIARHIDGRFAKFLEEAGRERFVEKTPSNCLRIPFIHALYPDCRMIHIVRDGRDVVRSTLKIRERAPRQGIVLGRLRTTPFWEWPSYVPMFFRTVFRTNLLGAPSTQWGVLPPGWQDWNALPPYLAIAHQWVSVVSAALQDGRGLPPENYLELRYEDLIAGPARWIRTMAEFAELAPSAEMLAFAAERIDPARPGKWRAVLTPEMEAEVEAIERPLLVALGYALSRGDSSVLGAITPE